MKERNMEEISRDGKREEGNEGKDGRKIIRGRNGMRKEFRQRWKNGGRNRQEKDEGRERDRVT